VGKVHELPASVSVREASSDDRHLLEKLRASVGWSTAETGLTAVEAGRSVIYILNVDGEPAASGALVFRNDDPELADGASRAMISNLIVSPRYQDHGLGTELLAFLESEAQQRGIDRIAIGVDKPNVRARQLYERHGYTHLKDKSELWGPVNYLWKMLGRP
jgi:ribosomal protein S18 acetylase RimI-like enzyme